jgi:hypothetical protein
MNYGHNELVKEGGSPWPASEDHEHVVSWVRFLRFQGMDAERIRQELARFTRDGMTQIRVGGYSRTMPVALAQAIVEQAIELASTEGAHAERTQAKPT